MNDHEKRDLLERAKKFFRDVIVKNHIKNTKALASLDKFNVNPFLVKYLANFLTGKSDSKSAARVLVYARALATSINTSFGSNLQKFCNEVLRSAGATTEGIDIEFEDALDNRRKYCQIKAGPQTINKDDVETVSRHFEKIKRTSRTNGLKLEFGDLVVGVLYGDDSEISGNYLNLKKEYEILVGKDFWYHLTGDKNFYFELIDSFAGVANEIDARKVLEATITKLAENIDREGSVLGLK